MQLQRSNVGQMQYEYSCVDLVRAECNVKMCPARANPVVGILKHYSMRNLMKVNK